MKIDRSKLKKSNSELPESCKQLIERLVSAGSDDNALYNILTEVQSWEYGKSELYHWVDVLDIFDDIMERCCQSVGDNKWMLMCDQPENAQLKHLMLQVVRFTSLLIEHSFQRYSYESMDHLIRLLTSSDMCVVLEVLNVLYVFSKRSNFITRLSANRKMGIVMRLHYLAESWGGKENGFGLAECSQDLPLDSYPASATTLHFEFYLNKNLSKQSSHCTIHLEGVDKMCSSPAELMTKVLAEYDVPQNKHMLLFTHIRLAHSFSNFKERTSCILARLQAISVLVYSHAIDNEVAHQIIYNGFINELINVLELPSEELTEMKAAVMRTLTAIIHLERNPKLDAIIDITGANTYHGFLPSLVRKCILHMVEPNLTGFPHAFSTALFSFLYHLASYESGGEALLSCGIMPSLLKLASWHSDEQEHITFVTRAVRIIDLMTNMCTQSFETHGGLKVFIDRLEHEVNLCRKEQPFTIRPKRLTSLNSIDMSAHDAMDYERPVSGLDSIHEQLAETSDATSTETPAAVATNSEDASMEVEHHISNVVVVPVLRLGVQCLPQRAALLKSILNFFKKVIPEPTLSFADSIRHIMEGSMPKALQHIISNAEYYGASLFLLALDVVTVFVFQEPSLLSSLQDKGLTDVVLHSLLVKDVPATREVLASLPNVFSALCLNQRGLDSFVQYKPFDKLFKVLLSPEYLPAMRKRKSSDAFGDTANNLGTAMDELMRHQPSLRVEAIKAIIGLLKQIIHLGTDPSFVCQSKAADPPAATPAASTTAPSSDIDSEDDEEVTQEPTTPTLKVAAAPTLEEVKAPQAVPLMDYILNVMKLIDAIMGNTTADDHCLAFIEQGGLEPLFSILRLPNLPIDFPTSQACQSVSSVCTVLLKLCHEPKVIDEGLKHLTEALKSVTKLYEPLPPPGGSVLLAELVSAVSDTVSVSEAVASPTCTPLLHNLSAVQAYIKMFVHMCRLGQAELKTISLDQWGSPKGLEVLDLLSKLYFSLVWEGTVLLALCSDSDLLPPDSDFGRADLSKLLPKGAAMETDSNSSSTGVTAAMESLTTADALAASLIDDDGEGTSGDGFMKKPSAALSAQVKQIRPLLNISSRLGSTLAELFQNVLVKLCVGSVMLRQRRSHHQPPPTPQAPTANARKITKALCNLAVDGLRWKPPTDAHVPKLQMSFLMCAVGFTLPLLFEENKHSYHLMLQEFTNEQGHQAFFDVFYNVVDNLPHTEGAGPSGPQLSLPDYTVDFLEAWLMLAEKMVQPKCILESIYLLPSKPGPNNASPFNPIQYLKYMQKPIFDAIVKLWSHRAITNTKGGEAINEQLETVAISILTILCHIVHGEKLIKEKEEKDQASTGKVSKPKFGAGSGWMVFSTPVQGTGPASLLEEAMNASTDQNDSRLSDLMDMGFPRDLCLQAIRVTHSVESATEYLLTHMTAGLAAGGSLGASATPPVSASSAPIDNTLSEEDQIRAAIELSLTSGEPIDSTPDSTPAVPQAVEPEPAASTSRSHYREELLSSSDIDDLTDTLVSGCLVMLDSMPSTVFTICQLVVAVAHRNGDQWRDDMFRQLLNEIQMSTNELCAEATKAPWTTPELAIAFFSKNERNVRLASRMHLLTLLIKELEAPFISRLHDSNFVNAMLNLLNACLPGLRLAGTASTPQWLASIMLIIDLCEKAATTACRKAEAKRLLGESNAWKWFDDRNGRWCAYNSTSNNTIDTAYRAGETSVRFTAGRRKYMVQFNAMIQLNEETQNRRPVMLSIPTKEEREKALCKPMETDVMQGLHEDQIRNLIRCCVELMAVPVECETLHAVLRLCLRCTRHQQMARLFAECSGVEKLLSLTQSSAFTGFTSICTLLIRHVLEDEQTLQSAIEKVVREAAAGIGSNFCGVSSNAIGCREINYVLRQLGPTTCRNPDMLKSVCKNLLRVELRDGKEPPWSTQHQVDLVVASPEKGFTTVQPSETFREVIVALLNILIQPYTPEESDSTKTTTGTQTEEQTDPSAAGDKAANNLATEVGKESCEPKPLPAEVNAKRPLLSKSAVLRMLSEFVKAYTCCANIIVQHSFTAGQSPMLDETCTALTFIFDKLLPANQEAGDKDCPALARVLLASIASCNHSPEAQISLVNELKGSIQRTLCLPEVTHKYTHLQCLTLLVTVLIEACPSAQDKNKHSSMLIKPLGQQYMNQMVMKMVKRGIVADLARIPHSLDLSNPATVATINALLKPLETLSRIVNLPQLAPNSARSNRSTNSGGDQTETPATGEAQEQGNAAEAGEGEVPDDQPQEDEYNNETAGNLEVQLEEQNADDMLNDEVNEEDVAMLNQVEAQVQILEQALDDILSQGQSDQSADDDEPNAADAAMSDDEAAGDGNEEAVDNEEVPYHEDEEDDTTDEEEDDEDDDDDDDDVDGENQNGGELGVDEDWSDDEDLGFASMANILGGWDDDDGLFSRLETYEPPPILETGVARPRILVAEPGSSEGYRTLQVPYNNVERDAAGEEAIQPLPPAPNPVPITHPLMNPASTDGPRTHPRGITGFGRAQRRAPARGDLRLGATTSDRTTQGLQMTIHTPQNNLLQRLFGAGMAANILQLTTRLGGASARLYISDDDQFRLFSRLDEDPFADILQDGMDRMKNNSGPGILSNLPSTMYRWIEECRVLDGASVHDVVTTVKVDIIDHLQAIKKEQLEATAKKEKEKAAQKTETKKERELTTASPSPPVPTSETSSMVPPAPTPIPLDPLCAPTPADERLLQSVESLFGEDSDVAQVFMRRHGLQNLMSVPTPQVLTPANQPLTITSIGVSLPSSSAPVNSQTASTAGAAASVPTTTASTESGQDRACTPPLSVYSADTLVPLQVSSQPEENEEDSTPALSEGNVIDVTPAEETIPTMEVATSALVVPESSTTDQTPNETMISSVEQEITTTPAAEPPAISREAAGPSSGAASQPEGLSGLEGVDPSFLEALPESIRQEVIAEQLRLARIQRQARETASASSNTAGTSSQVSDVNPEFLAALPPSIQEEVLAVQRAEQARQAAAQNGPDLSQDPATFLNSLPPSLRQQVLADMDDSQVSVLPSDLMAEAQLLRGELEDRNRRLHDQIFAGRSTLGNILRQTGLGGNRFSASRFLRRRGGGNSSHWSPGMPMRVPGAKSGGIVRRGRQLLDQEALTCLLVLLFLDEPRLNTNRLHRIFKNLGYHTDTLLWIIRALISILIKTNDSADATMEPSVSGKQPAQTVWLSFGMDPALGCRANVFHVHHNSKKSSTAAGGSAVTIHPQAAPLVCQHVIDTLIYMGKAFTGQFLPHTAENKETGKDTAKSKERDVKSKQPKQQSFWDVLVKLDQMRFTKKGKGLQRLSSGVSNSLADENSELSIEESPLGQLMSMLSSPVIRRSPTLTDRLLKLLSIVSSGIADNKLVNPSATTKSKTTSKPYLNTENVILPDQLTLAVEVLTSKSCSEEGLEDSTKLLIRLSHANTATKEAIVKLLLSGARQIGQTVGTHIDALLSEAREHNSKTSGLSGEDSTPDLLSLDTNATGGEELPGTSTSIARGQIPNRFRQGAVVTIAPGKAKRTHELQLASMAQLTAKSSSQQFLLRLLNVVIQLSESKRNDEQAALLATQSGADAGNTTTAEGTETASMDVDQPATKSELKLSLSERLSLDMLWESLGDCLTELSQSSDQNAVLILQPAVEAFFLVHAGQKEPTTAKSRRDRHRREDQLSHLNMDESPASPLPGGSTSEPPTEDLPPDTKKFLTFAETHRTVLNQILRQSQTPLSDGPFSVLVDHMKLLDFDVKLKYFRSELQKLDDGMRREDMAVHVRRDHVFEDSYRELFRRTADEWKHRLYIVFEGEEGQDAGGLLREWYVIMSREIFNPNYALFMTAPQDRVTYTINSLSYINPEHLSYFKFVGRIIAKAIYDNKLLECYFTRSFYKHIAGEHVKYTDMEAEDYSFFQGLEFLLTHNVNDLGYDQTFSVEIQELGVTKTKELKPGGSEILVTEENKKEYVKLVCQMKMTGAIRSQLNAFLEGFYDIIPKYLISIFNEQELELLISGLPTVDVDDLKTNTEYHKYTTNSLQIIWFWRALRSFDQAERARFLQFVTGTSKVPLQGFAFLEGMNGTQKFQIHRDDRSTDRLPCAHTCFNQLDLPAYETYDKLKKMLLLVINECSEGFGLA